VYVDDIITIGDNEVGIERLKTHLHSYFQSKDLAKLKYFLSINVAQSIHNVCISQRKYVLDILKETSVLDSRPIDNPMNPNIKLVPRQGESMKDPW